MPRCPKCKDCLYIVSTIVIDETNLCNRIT